MGKITVLLVEDHEIIRKGLRALLATQPDIEVVGEASNGHGKVSPIKAGCQPVKRISFPISYLSGCALLPRSLLDRHYSNL